MSAYLVGLARKARLYSGTRKNVLWVLVDCCHEDGTRIYPALKTLAEDAECSVSTARRTLKEFCRVGLLRRVREGGNGPKSTAHYELDVEMLLSLRRPEMWPALEAASLHEPLSDGDDDADAEHAADASQAADACEKKGVKVEAFQNGSLSPAPLRVPSGDTQPLSRTLNEREGVRTHESAPASEGERLPTPTFEDFLEAYPHAKIDNRTKLRNFWEALAFDQRRLAIDGITAFLAERKAGGYRGRMPSTEYLLGRNWIGLESKIAHRESKQAAGALIEVKGWSEKWWLTLLLRIAEGARQRVSFMLQQADGGKSISVSAGDLDAGAKRIGELRPFLCHGREIDAWRPWLAERGARIPVFAENSSFRVFLPNETPPAGRAEAGDDEVKF